MRDRNSDGLSLIVLRATPLLLILSAMLMAAIAAWLSDQPEPFIRFAELVATGALGNLAPSFGDQPIVTRGKDYAPTGTFRPTPPSEPFIRRGP
jgi:hypothetical protein